VKDTPEANRIRQRKFRDKQETDANSARLIEEHNRYTRFVELVARDLKRYNRSMYDLITSDKFQSWWEKHTGERWSSDTFYELPRIIRVVESVGN